MNRLKRELTIEALVFLLSTTPASYTTQNNINQLGGSQVPYEQSPRSQTPKERRIVAVFSGHTPLPPTKLDRKGVTSYSGIPEHKFNDDLVRLFSEVRNPAFSYIPVLAEENKSILQRPKIALDYGANLYIEIHHDSAQLEDILKLKQRNATEEEWKELSGFSVFYSPVNRHPSNSLRLATLIGEELTKEGFNPNHYHAKKIKGEDKKLVDPKNGVYEDKFFVLDKATVPAVIVEAGVITNPYEEVKLKDPQTKVKFVTAIDRAITRYFSEVLNKPIE